MSTAGDRGWGPAGARRGQLRQVRVAGSLPMMVRAEVAPIMQALVDRVDAVRAAHGIAPLTSSGGYVKRPIRGYEKKYAETRQAAYLSNHSWGLAMDLSATTNPLGARLVTDMPPGTAAIAADLGLTWGGSYAGRKDAMHFEFMGTPLDAARVTDRLRTVQHPDARTATDDEDDDMTAEHVLHQEQVLLVLTDILANLVGLRNDLGRPTTERPATIRDHVEHLADRVGAAAAVTVTD